LIVSTVAAQRRALFVLALTLTIAGTRFVTESWAAGAFAVGKCGSYGHAYDYAGEGAARAAALKQCKGDCTAITMKRACAALAVDMKNPCGPHGYAVRRHTELAQRSHAGMLQVRRKGMRDPRLGLRRQGVAPQFSTMRWPTA
jgi:hypothetical protein